MTTLAEARRLALSLPSTEELPHFQATSFRVRGKIYATAPDSDHLHVFLGEEARAQAVALYPGFIETLAWGAKIVGLRIHLADARNEVVAWLLELAWRAKAPKALQ